MRVNVDVGFMGLVETFFKFFVQIIVLFVGFIQFRNSIFTNSRRSSIIFTKSRRIIGRRGLDMKTRIARVERSCTCRLERIQHKSGLIVSETSKH